MKCPEGLSILIAIEKLVVRMFKEGHFLVTERKQNGLREKWQVYGHPGFGFLL